jgi:hypothetical protein
MPSIHVGWAVLFAVVAWGTGSNTGRVLTIGHAGLTSYVVVVTGNHFWADGVVAAAIIAVVLVAMRLASARVATADALPDGPVHIDLPRPAEPEDRLTAGSRRG